MGFQFVPSTTETTLPVRLRLIGVLILLGVGWGSTQALGKLAVSSGHQHFGLIFWQATIGIVVLGTLNLVRRGHFSLSRAGLRFAFIIACIGTLIPNSTFYISVVHLPSGVMSILISTIPMLSLPMALALGMDRLHPLRLLGLLCGFVGVALIALPQTSLPTPEMAAWLPLAMVGPVFYAMEGNYVAKWGMGGLDAVQAMFWASLLAALLALSLALGSGQWIDPRPPYGTPELALMTSSAIHALMYAAYVWLAAKAGAVFATQTSYVVTISGVLWAMLLLDEQFSAWVWAAMAVMLVGLFLVQPHQRAVEPIGAN
jgi:drug/metabolite transporter (DMT)-like permease